MSEARFDEPDDVVLPEKDPAAVAATETPEQVNASVATESAAVVPVKEVEEEAKPVPTVPLAALHEERAKSRARIAALEQTQTQRDEQFRQLKGEMAEWRKSLQQGQEAKQFQSDPLGAMQKTQADTLAELRQLKENQDQAELSRQSAEQQTSQLNEIRRTVTSQVEEFKRTAPDYDAAYEHVKQARTRQLQRIGRSPQEIEQFLQQDEAAVIGYALQNGENSAQVLYDLAKDAYGYRPTLPDSPPKPVDKLAQIEAGQKASSTLSNTQGAAPTSPLADLAKMSDEEFEKLDPKKFDALWEEFGRASKAADRRR